jgi:hypothetical protein
MIILPLFAVLILAQPAPVLATSGSTLSGSMLTDDAVEFQTILEQMKDEESREAQDAVDALGDDFFPVSGTGTDAIEEGDFVKVLFEGGEVELTDVPNASWFAPYVRDVAERAIVSGYKDESGKPTGIFGPERPVSIEELAKMALMAAGTYTAACPATAKNVSAQGRWSEQLIACTEAAKLTIFSDATVDVTRPALRGEVVVTILEAFGAAKNAVVDVSPFTDVTGATLFAPAILQAAGDGIISGYADARGNATGFFGPENTITRAEVAKVISMAIQVYGQ